MGRVGGRRGPVGEARGRRKRRRKGTHFALGFDKRFGHVGVPGRAHVVGRLDADLCELWPRGVAGVQVLGHRVARLGVEEHLPGVLEDGRELLVPRPAGAAFEQAGVPLVLGGAEELVPGDDRLLHVLALVLQGVVRPQLLRQGGHVRRDLRRRQRRRGAARGARRRGRRRREVGPIVVAAEEPRLAALLLLGLVEEPALGAVHGAWWLGSGMSSTMGSGLVARCEQQ